MERQTESWKKGPQRKTATEPARDGDTDGEMEERAQETDTGKE